MRCELCREPELLGAAWFATASCPKFPLHEQDELELNLVLRGTAHIIADRERYRVRRGDLVWLPSGCRHGLVDESDDLVMWVVSARREAVELVSHLAPDFTLRAAHRALSGAALGRLSEACFALLRAQRNTQYFNALLVAFLLEVANTRGSGARPVALHGAVERAAGLLARSETRWPLPRLAKQVGLSPYQLSRLFHQQLGVTLVHYANHERVQLFGQLHAARPDASTLNLAFQAGFGSYSQFFRIFRAVTGWSPDRFRSLCRDGILPTSSAPRASGF